MEWLTVQCLLWALSYRHSIYIHYENSKQPRPEWILKSLNWETCLGKSVQGLRMHVMYCTMLVLTSTWRITTSLRQWKCYSASWRAPCVHFIQSGLCTHSKTEMCKKKKNTQHLNANQQSFWWYRFKMKKYGINFNIFLTLFASCAWHDGQLGFNDKQGYGDSSLLSCPHRLWAHPLASLVSTVGSSACLSLTWICCKW